MTQVVDRTIFRSGEAAIAVTLPIGWIRYAGLKPGDKVEIVINDNDLVIRPKKDAPPNPRQMSIRK
ncbi:MAG: AbrB/MazE/SpoVT family DNA-binding domain-containing protein [Chloroflexi bacterium]|nr:AbrB/MazE/SpoVT family DNA-binding domain-containing protein [Chloroflexota bacterium]